MEHFAASLGGPLSVHVVDEATCWKRQIERRDQKFLFIKQGATWLTASERGMRRGVKWETDPREACERRRQPMDQRGLDRTRADEGIRVIRMRIAALAWGGSIAVKCCLGFGRSLKERQVSRRKTRKLKNSFGMRWKCIIRR